MKEQTNPKTVHEYLKQKIEKHNTLLSYVASIDHAEYRREGCCGNEMYVKQKIVGIKPQEFKHLKTWITTAYRENRGTISGIHEMVRLGLIPKWDGYNQFEHGIHNLKELKTDIAMRELHKIWWDRVMKIREEQLQDEVIKTASCTL